MYYKFSLKFIEQTSLEHLLLTRSWDPCENEYRIVLVFRNIRFREGRRELLAQCSGLQVAVNVCEHCVSTEKSVSRTSEFRYCQLKCCQN